MRSRLLAGLCSLAVASSCGGGGTHSAEVTVTFPDGKKTSTTLSDDSGFLFSGAGRAGFSFPDIAEWGTKVPLGLSLDLAPLQPGTYEASGFLHTGDDTVARAKAVSGTVRVERVTWQGSGAFPFRLEGTWEGTSAQGHQVTARFSTTTDDCSDKVRANGASWMCGYVSPYEDRRFRIGRWASDGQCPPGLLERWGGGQTLEVGLSGAKAGGQRSLECLKTYANGSKLLCGASEAGLALDGCTWSVSVHAFSGEARYAIIAGTTGSTCAPRLCTLWAEELAPQP